MTLSQSLPPTAAMVTLQVYDEYHLPHPLDLRAPVIGIDYTPTDTIYPEAGNAMIAACNQLSRLRFTYPHLRFNGRIDVFENMGDHTSHFTYNTDGYETIGYIEQTEEEVQHAVAA